MSHARPIARCLTLAMVSFAVVLGAHRPASAIPAFARKYQTSCQTCHVVFPKLNPFGEAFRLNGYRMPAETEEEIKETPVSLGSEAYKKTWPSMVYPSTIPGHVPLAINIKMADVYASQTDGTNRTITRNDFQFPQEVNLFAAGTFGDTFGYLAELTFENGAGVSIERAQLTANSLFGAGHAVNFKVGMFAPDLEDGFHEMWLMTNNGIDSLFTYNPIGPNGGTGTAEEGGGISLPENVKAIEFYGVAKHRLFYTLGVTDGLGQVSTDPGSNPQSTGNDVHSAKDWYARVDYKFGGMGLDGDTTGKTLPPENWRESSVRVGLLGYYGTGNDVVFHEFDDLGNPTFDVIDRRYVRAGLYASWLWRDLNVFGVYLHGKDDLTTTDLTTAAVTQPNPTYDAWFVQADYVIRPPFQVSLRYEDVAPGDPSAASIRVGNANFTYLIVANMKLMLEYQRDLHESKNYNAAAVLRFAF
ncbi:MAG TPA: hypothetical protein VFV19_18425 [Candidatus Polarisedimenticolaceae bacterium]|nr:hypothetical protein [Candidatus Polarisedimenticolaceae bacterium]